MAYHFILKTGTVNSFRMLINITFQSNYCCECLKSGIFSIVFQFFLLLLLIWGGWNQELFVVFRFVDFCGMLYKVIYLHSSGDSLCSACLLCDCCKKKQNIVTWWIAYRWVSIGKGNYWILIYLVPVLHKSLSYKFLCSQSQSSVHYLATTSNTGHSSASRLNILTGWLPSLSSVISGLSIWSSLHNLNRDYTESTVPLFRVVIVMWMSFFLLCCNLVTVLSSV